jgi:histidine triad (HIT) family protein
VDDCVFCALVAGRLPVRRVWEDERHLAFLPLRSFAPAHTLLVPKRHAAYVFDLDDGDYQGLWAAARWLAPGIREVSGAARVGVLVEGFSVPHVHVHLVPVNRLADIDPARERALPDAEADRIADALRAAFEGAVAVPGAPVDDAACAMIAGQPTAGARR